MVAAHEDQYHIGEKPTVITYTYFNRYAGTPQKYTKNLDKLLMVYRQTYHCISDSLLVVPLDYYE